MIDAATLYQKELESQLMALMASQIELELNAEFIARAKLFPHHELDLDDDEVSMEFTEYSNQPVLSVLQRWRQLVSTRK